MTYKVALIGAGQLGSRYLQGLAQSALDLSIEIVEPYSASAQTAKERFDQMPLNAHITSLHFHESLASLSDTLDLVIIATGADVRFDILKELLLSKKVKNLILEKVLFQKIEDYHKALDLLTENKVQAWVNHPRRLFPFYQKLKEKLAKATKINYSFQGGDWGLGCNGLHFIDHFSFLTDSDNVSIHNQHVHNTLYPSKRNGFIEFNGTLLGSSGDHSFSITSIDQPATGVLSIVSDILTCTIDETNGYIRIAEKENNWKWMEINEKIIYFQSELTAPTVEEILLYGTSKLPSYNKAMQLHIVFLKALLDKMRQIDGCEHSTCSIT
jgi:hypothetical protein